MILPHRIIDRDLIFEEGPMSFRDLTDTIRHARMTHRRWAQPDLRRAWVSTGQLFDLHRAPEFAPYRDYPAHPGTVATVWGLDIMRGQPPQREYPAAYVHPNDVPVAHIVPTGEPVAPNPYVTMTTATHALNQQNAERWYDALAQQWKVQFDTDTLKAQLKGIKFEAAWIDDLKPVETTHENW